MDIGQLLFSFQGRINRKTYWLAILPFAVSYAVADLMTASANRSFVGLGYFIMVVLILPSLAVQTKRWHDRNKSGWWNLISLIPVVGPIWAIIELGFLKGIDAGNSYGLPQAARPSYNYGAQINDLPDTYISDPRRESEPVASGSSISNSWRGQ